MGVAMEAIRAFPYRARCAAAGVATDATVDLQTNRQLAIAATVGDVFHIPCVTVHCPSILPSHGALIRK